MGWPTFCSLLLKERVTILEKPKPVAILSGREPTFLLGGGRNANVLALTGHRAGFGGDGKREMELERIREAAERVARSVGMDVVDVEWKVGKQRFLRVYIDKPEGISHRDCETVSNQLSVILDVEDLVPGPPYILEVSSPGLDRKLTKPAEFERFAGRLARISTHGAGGESEIFRRPPGGRRRRQGADRSERPGDCFADGRNSQSEPGG